MNVLRSGVVGMHGQKRCCCGVARPAVCSTGSHMVAQERTSWWSLFDQIAFDSMLATSVQFISVKL